MSDLAREVAQAVRTSLRNRGFTSIAVLTLALGIGASTGIYSVVDATLLRPLPFPDASRLAFVWGVAGPDRDIRGASHPEVMDWRQSVPAFTTMSIYDTPEMVIGTGSGNVERVPAETVSSTYFGLLGVRPLLGRVLQAADEVPGAPQVAVISHDLWQRRFGGADDVVGMPLRIGTQTFQVVGVLPEHVRGLSLESQLWTTLAPLLSPEEFAQRGSRWLAAVGRLAPGVTVVAAQQQLDAVARRLAQTYPETNHERGAQLVPLRQQYVGNTEGVLLILLGAVALLLILACAHVANLLLVRGTARSGELALRFALGATRGRVLRHLLVESTTLALFGGVVALVLAFWGIQLLLPLVPDGVLPPYADVRLSPSVLGVGLGLALLAGLAAGGIPALRATRQGISGGLESGRVVSGGTRRWGAQHAFVAAGVAVTLVLLVGAGLLLRSFQQQIAIDTGFDAEDLLVARFSMAATSITAADRASALARIDEALRARPEVSDLAFTSDAPLGSSSSAFITRPNDRPDIDMRVYRHQVSTNYFELLGINVQKGRAFTVSDKAEAPFVAVVSDALARRMWPGQEAIGRTLEVGERQATVIGIVDNVRQRTLTTDPHDPGEDPDVYFHYPQAAAGAVDLLVKTTAPPTAAAAAVRAALVNVDRDLALARVEPLALGLRQQTAAGRFGSSLLTVFAVLSLILAATGIYGVLSFLVNTRRREMAIRMALGASTGSVRWLVLRQGGFVVGIGLAAGLALALPGARLLSAYLYGVTPGDPRTVIVAVTLLGTAAFAASWFPARRATRLDPHTAFRAQ